MSFIIVVYTNEGIVMASDSRTTYTTTKTLDDGTKEKQIGVQITDSTNKIFLCNKFVGLSTCGTASINGMPISGYIEKFIATSFNEDSSVEDVANNILQYFTAIEPSLNTNFIVAGYNKATSNPSISRVYVASKEIIPVKNPNNPGVVWDGEADILKRLVKDVSLKNQDGTYSDLDMFPIGYNYFTLQDAIDFAEYAVDVTIKTMFFQDRVKTVGGPIDILAIKPSGAVWIKRKELHA